MSALLPGQLLAGALMILAPVSAQSAETLDGAFGLRFDAAVPEQVLGASTLAPADLPHRPFADEYPPERAGWFYFTPVIAPDPLGAARYQVLVTGNGQPALILARLVGHGCNETYTWLVDSLTRKYAIKDDPAVLPRPPYLQAASFQVDGVSVDLACGRDLVLAYTLPSGIRRWQAEQVALENARETEAQRLVEVARRIERAEARAYADTFTHGEKFRLDGGLGLIFGEPFRTTVPHTPDVPFAMRPPRLPPPFDTGSFELTLDPEDVPIRLEGSIPDPDGRHYEKITGALQAKFGAAMKDTDRHRIFRVNGNYFTLRQIRDRTDITLIDIRAQKAQEARAAAAKAAELAAAEARFKAETEGL
ncbi:MAG: hypothetical protein R3E82_05605 [Pseudomonadales bacterium]